MAELSAMLSIGAYKSRRIREGVMYCSGEVLRMCCVNVCRN